MKSKKAMNDCPGCDKLFELQSKAGLVEENVILFRLEMEKVQKTQEKNNDRFIASLDELRERWAMDMRDVAEKISAAMHKITKSELRIILFMLTTLISAIIAIVSRFIK